MYKLNFVFAKERTFQELILSLPGDFDFYCLLLKAFFYCDIKETYNKSKNPLFNPPKKSTTTLLTDRSPHNIHLQNQTKHILNYLYRPNERKKKNNDKLRQSKYEFQLIHIVYAKHHRHT